MRVIVSENARYWISYGICLLCLFLFLTSAYTKVNKHETFASGLSSVQVIGSSAEIIAWCVPLAELLVSILLIIPSTQRWGLYGFIGIMLIFTIYVGSMLIWAEKLPCNCNLIIEKLSWSEHVVFNLSFIGLAVLALWLDKTIKYKP